jgi:hypothetical protein
MPVAIESETNSRVDVSCWSSNLDWVGAVAINTLLLDEKEIEGGGLNYRGFR